jgi:LmbE family N-acetylglucosaminyl deacetylase
MGPRALAIAAHPDDIEFMMAGTLCLLRDAGWEIHYLNVSTGNLGSVKGSAAATARTRRKEARAAAALLGAVWHAPFRNDLEISYDTPTLRRLCAIVREVAPTVILTQSPQDYMEDHVNTMRLAVTAAFSRGVPNYRSTPPRAPVSNDVTIYHASPHGLRDTLRRRVHPGAFVNTAPVHEQKRAALACHASQRQWLAASQGMDNYISTMDAFSRELGRLSHRFRHAEGWRRHSHWGFSAEDVDPLRDALGSKYFVSAAYERSLDT